MSNLLSSIEAEYRRYKALADAAMIQLSEAELADPAPGGGNSVAVIAWHVGGNLASRFTDFLTTDGEKPWRHREEEFASRAPSRSELDEHWEHGWRALFDAMGGLTEENLGRDVVIRGKKLSVHAALHRSLAHASYHVGQIVFLAKALRGEEWKFLSIPPGGSEAYNANPTKERPDQHTGSLTDET